jgi:adenylate kinase family enzyme
MGAGYKNIRRINVVGTSGSGKSTFAQKLAAIIDAPYVEMDRLYWGPEWSESMDDVFIAKLREAISSDTWVLDGNYTRTTPVKWQDVQMVIWLDFSFPLVMKRVISRALYRIISQKELWPGTGNRESIKKLLGKGSIVRWAISTYDSNILKYEIMMNDMKYQHIIFVRIKSQREANDFLKKLRKC